jgi:hypothetical protein
MFGHITDTTQNGRMPGGVAMDATDPAGERPSTLAGRIDPKSAWNPRTSPTAIAALLLIVFVYLNAKARRSARKG